MRKKSTMFLTGFITGILLTFLLLLVLAPRIIFTKTESKYNFAQTVDLIEQSIRDNGWSMPHQYDLQATLNKHGFAVKPVRVFSICKPDLAARILGSDDDRHISAMMPCRVAVYENENGKTYIARMNAILLSKLLGNNAEAVMRDAGQESERILEPLLK